MAVGAVSEPAPGILRIEAPLGDRFCCAYALVGEHPVLIDTGVAATPGETILPALAHRGIVPERVVISHADFDHHGGNEPIRKAFPRARLACHAADRRQIEDPERLIAERYGEFGPRYGMPADPAGEDVIRAQTTAVAVDETVGEGERLIAGGRAPIEIWHVPGHSRGHLAFVQDASRTAIIADAVLGDTLRTAAGAPAFPPTYRYVSDYRRTIARLRELAPRRLLTSHFPVIEGDDDVQAFLRLSDAFVDSVEAALLTVLDAGGAGGPGGRGWTLPELVDALAPALGPWAPSARPFLAHPLAGHLEDLTNRGVVHGDGGPVPRFALVTS